MHTPAEKRARCALLAEEPFLRQQLGRHTVECVVARLVAADEAADRPAEEYCEANDKDHAGKLPGEQCTQEQRGHCETDKGQCRDNHCVDAWSQAGAELGQTTCHSEAAMQLQDKRAEARLRLHQRDGLFRRREDRDVTTVGMIDIGAKAAVLHTHRPIGQPDRRDIRIGPDTRATTCAP